MVPYLAVISVLLFSDPAVKAKLFERVDATRRPLLVTQVRQDKLAAPIEEREPFAALDDVFGHLVDQLVVADDGTPEGMWRDPVGDLADRFFPNDRDAAYAASTGYMLIANGRIVATVKKRSVTEDLWFIQEALSSFVPGVPAPHRKRPPAPEPRERSRRPAPRLPEEPIASSPAAPDPWTILGISRATPIDEAKRAFRALIAQYHPDKVSHLAPEFRELAERRTREILDAWQLIEDRHR